MHVDKPTRPVIPLQSQAAAPANMSPAQARAQAKLQPAPWRWALLLHAPHRLAFASAVAVMTLASLWWWLVMVG
ncbi:MAG: hypothetical protein E6Q31_00400, partial [Aquabacterium sp.]